jgi:hypothetical protein
MATAPSPPGKASPCCRECTKRLKTVRSNEAYDDQSAAVDDDNRNTPCSGSKGRVLIARQPPGLVKV